MIRKLKPDDLDVVMDIWLTSNVEAHDFIKKEYWTDNFEEVKGQLPSAEVYVYEDEENKEITGFIGLNDNFIEGIFVKKAARSKGAGKRMLNFVKDIKPTLILKVYRKNVRAIDFYKREGFKMHSESLDESTGEEELNMTWNK